jgi:hypothetical protein
MKKWIGLLFFALGLIARPADDDYTFARSQNPADYQFWGQANGDVSAAIYVHPLKTADIPDQVPVAFGVLLENKSPQARYAYSRGGRHGYCHLKIIDSAGKEYPLREEPSHGAAGSYVILPAGGRLMGTVFVSPWELRAIGNTRLIATVELYDRPSRADPQVKIIVVESAPFQIYPLGPAQTPVPDDPMMVQWKIEEKKRSNALDQAASPEAKSSAASDLASFYLAYEGDFDRAEALLPEITDPVDNFDTRVMLVCQNPDFTDAQKTDGLEALAINCPSGRQEMLENLIGKYHYAATHPTK